MEGGFKKGGLVVNKTRENAGQWMCDAPVDVNAKKRGKFNYLAMAIIQVLYSAAYYSYYANLGYTR